jgi:hypothetical protein
MNTQTEGDRLATDAETAFNDLIERTHKLLARPALHSHVCSHCGFLRICVQRSCPYRANDLERSWTCGCSHE